MKKRYNINDAYDHNFYKRSDVIPNKFHTIISRFFNKNFDISYVIDWGCGTGIQLESIKSNFPNTKIFGIESSFHAKSFLKKRINDNYKIIDLRDNIILDNKASLSISIEVAEHIEEHFSLTFVQNITNHTTKSIFLTAAVIGQRGHHHCNCQPNKYWIKLFEQNGFVFNNSQTKEFKEFYKKELKPKYGGLHFLSNTMIFERK